MVFSTMPPAVTNVKAGRIRALAVTTPTRNAAAPDVPTVSEAGLKGFDIVLYSGVLGPAAMPPAIVGKLNAEITRIFQAPDVKTRLDVLSLEFTPNTPAEFAARLKAEVQRYAKMVKAAGAKAD